MIACAGALRRGILGRFSSLPVFHAELHVAPMSPGLGRYRAPVRETANASQLWGKPYNLPPLDCVLRSSVAGLTSREFLGRVKKQVASTDHKVTKNLSVDLDSIHIVLKCQLGPSIPGLNHQNLSFVKRANPKME